MFATLRKRLGVRRDRDRAELRDGRSGRLVFLIECLTNQNARDAGAATRSSVTREVLDILLQNDVGMAQIPCPEMACLGFKRARPAGTSIRSALQEPDAQQHCRLLAQQIAERIADYREQGYEVLAILGGNESSPGCAIHCAGDSKATNALRAGSGVFMQALATELEQRSVTVPFRGVRDADASLLEQDLAWLRATIVKRQDAR